MFTKSNNKVKFQDQQLDDYVLENSVLKSKLQSKIDALSIMSRELDKCSMERDRYKMLVEQFQCKQAVPIQDCDIFRFAPTNTISGGEMIAKTRDQNNMLKIEVETLRSKLEEATLDNVALRKNLQKIESQGEFNGLNRSISFTHTNKDFEQLVQELEKVRKKYQQFQLDYRATLDEKEELASDRDYYKNKVQRLNHQISYILSNRIKRQQDNDVELPKPIVDIDALVTENKYMHERITQLEVEKEIIKRSLTKYKTLLDNRNKNEVLNIKKGFIDVMTQKQVRQFLDMNPKTQVKRTTVAEIKSVCLGLLEALNDKSIALEHQRKTNQILANRINELEKTLESWCSGQNYIPIFPSQMLLEEFLPDKEPVKSDDAKNKIDQNDIQLDMEKDKYSDSDDEIKNSDESSEARSNEERSESNENGFTTRTVLPFELEQLVKEALAELKPME